MYFLPTFKKMKTVCSPSFHNTSLSSLLLEAPILHQITSILLMNILGRLFSDSPRSETLNTMLQSFLIFGTEVTLIQMLGFCFFFFSSLCAFWWINLDKMLEDSNKYLPSWIPCRLLPPFWKESSWRSHAPSSFFWYYLWDLPPSPHLPTYTRTISDSYNMQLYITSYFLFLLSSLTTSLSHNHPPY